MGVAERSASASLTAQRPSESLGEVADEQRHCLVDEYGLPNEPTMVATSLCGRYVRGEMSADAPLEECCEDCIRVAIRRGDLEDWR